MILYSLLHGICMTQMKGPWILYSLLHGICMTQMKGPCDTLFVVTWHLYDTDEIAM